MFKFCNKLLNSNSAFSLTVHRFRVKDKEEIEDPKSASKMLIFPSNCQLRARAKISSQNWRPDFGQIWLRRLS